MIGRPRRVAAVNHVYSGVGGKEARNNSIHLNIYSVEDHYNIGTEITGADTKELLHGRFM